MSNFLGRLTGNIKLTLMIGLMVLFSVAVSIVAVLVTVSVILSGNARDEVRAELANNVRVAASQLYIEQPGVELTWSDSGDIARIEAKTMPKFRNDALIDNITRVTGEKAAFFVVDSATGDFLRKSTNILLDTGERAVDAPLAKDGPIHEVVLRGETYSGRSEILGVRYYATYQPIVNAADEVIGILLVAIPEAKIDARASKSLQMLLLVGALTAAAIGGLGLIISRLITKPIPKLSAAMRSITGGNLQTVVPYTSYRNEIGAMAGDVEGFRLNAVKIADLGAAEAAGQVQRQSDRHDMMQAMQRSFGTVVDAAIAGDLSRRVETNFADEELNELARSVNSLVENVDRGISETGRVLGALAQTDLTHRVTGAYQGAFDRLKTDTNSVVDNLASVVRQLRETSDSLRIATGEILAGANDLSERTTRQASAIEETSAAMEQLAITVVDNAKRAEQASSKAQAVSLTAEETGEVMKKSNEAMERIATSSGKISNIIGLIDDVAFQTNLLALNASVEAARAGDAGKGFAVVAVEVRRLAQSAASASSEVKALIEQSANEVTGGSKLVAEATQKLTSMLDGVRESAGLIQSIATASQEQSGAIVEVTTAIRQMDEMTQHNAALVEETNAAIEQTEGQANELDRIVEVFVVDGIARSLARAPVRGEPSPQTSKPGGVKALQARVKSAAKSYLSNGNAALKRD